MYAVITISNVGADVTGPFDLFSDVDGYISAFVYNVSLADLISGYAVDLPDGTETVRIQMSGFLETGCSYYIVDTSITTTTTTTTV